MVQALYCTFVARPDGMQPAIKLILVHILRKI